ncbi:hypothetical protein [Streptomyces sp. NPDC059134]|uniref:hypothetical protein n=1 Tax=Streptomyces sp. NPDC059134 TaxID=3346738 RepID=UPI003680D697
MTTELAKRRTAVFALFFIPGLTISSWVSRTPDVRDLVGASTAEMGLILFGLAAGSMVGVLFSGPLVALWGARPVIAAGTTAVAAGAGVIGIGAGAGSGFGVALGLALFGLGMGGGEVALNVEGAEVERLLGRSTMPAMHGFFSLGTVVGALGGMGLTAVEFPVLVHLAVVAAVVLCVLFFVIRRVPHGVGRGGGAPAPGNGAGPARGVLVPPDVGDRGGMAAPPRGGGGGGAEGRPRPGLRCAGPVRRPRSRGGRRPPPTGRWSRPRRGRGSP